jgi:NTP pyrophosphatase (non-canonical NTP hydrolase)
MKPEDWKRFSARELSVDYLVNESFGTAMVKGWHDEDSQPPSAAVRGVAVEGLYIANACARIEGIRKGSLAVTDLYLAPEDIVERLDDKQVRVLSWLALICTEAAEAMDDVIAGRWETVVNSNGKPEGLGSELADIIIRVCDDVGALGIDLKAELLAKMSFNRTRPYRHGGKAV